MPVLRAPPLLVLGLLACLESGLGAAAPASAKASAGGQDTLARAKDLYGLAAYDEALAVLDRLHETAPPDVSSEVAGYQVLCLLALGRTNDAQKAIEALVKADPLYRPSESIMSPRTRARFDAVRRELLPAIVQETYDKAKAAFDRKELPVALTEFDRVVALLDDPALADVPNMADLRRLATGFRDLSKAATPVVPASPAPATSNAAIPTAAAVPPAPDPARTYTGDDAGVVPPIVVSRRTPIWTPRNEIEKRREFRGILEVVIDEAGDVTSAALGKSIHPAYDKPLVDTARTWKFRPATKDGVAVKYRMTIEIRLGPPAR
jgi:TonB family protein